MGELLSGNIDHILYPKLADKYINYTQNINYPITLSYIFLVIKHRNYQLIKFLLIIF